MRGSLFLGQSLRLLLKVQLLINLIQAATEKAVREAIELGLLKVELLIKGEGSGRETAIRALQVLGLEVLSIKDITSVPHNGCRPSKSRRV
jgi:small subunit ribosomal protein S11